MTTEETEDAKVISELLTPEKNLEVLLIMKAEIASLYEMVGMLSRVLNQYCLEYPLNAAKQPVESSKPETQLHGHGLYL